MNIKQIDLVCRICGKKYGIMTPPFGWGFVCNDCLEEEE